MRVIEWYSENTEDNFFNDFSSTIRYGKTYHLFENDKKGYVIYNMGYIEYGDIVAEGQFGSIRMYIKDESTILKRKRTLNFVKINDTNEGRLKTSPMIVYRKYNSNAKEKSIFTYKRKHDLEIEYYKIYTDIFAKLKANMVNNKWYENVSTSNIDGVLELYDNKLEEDFIICSFFSLAEYLITSRDN
jgi:hypothetical protein